MMTTIERKIEQIPGLEPGGQRAIRTIHDLVLKGGPLARKLADLLHGTWLGHPLHPVLIAIPTTAWGLGSAFDLIAALNDSDDAARTADTMIAIGTVAALPTALAGVTDYSTVPEPAAAPATVHGLMNSAGLVLYLLSLNDRRHSNYGRARVLAGLAFAIVGASAWVGGELVYRLGVGVDHADRKSGPQHWTAVLDAAELRESTPQRVELEGVPVLLYREGNQVWAIGATCSHAGGPLDQGSLEGHCIRCPWHDSVFDLRDGSVQHGPATQEQPRYAARIRNGRVELRHET